MNTGSDNGLVVNKKNDGMLTIKILTFEIVAIIVADNVTLYEPDVNKSSPVTNTCKQYS